MIKHNRKIAARRRSRKSKDGQPDNIATGSVQPSGLYLRTIETFAEEQDCSDPGSLADLADVQEIAARFKKTPAEVARDINRVYVASYRPLISRRLNLLDTDGDEDG